MRALLSFGICLVIATSGVNAFQKLNLRNANDRTPTLVNQYGAVIQDSNGKRTNYSQTELGTQQRHSEKKQPDQASTTQTPSSTAGASWTYATLGAGIGISNIIVSQNGAASEIYTGASFNAYWVAMRFDPIAHDYDEIFVSPYFSSNIKRIKVADLIGNSTNEIVVALDDGHINLYDQATKALVSTFSTTASGINGMDIADVDGDGLNEIVLCTGSRLYVYSGSGTLKWDLGGVSGNDLVVAQMDADPALEVAMTDGHVVDCATHAVQWTWPNRFGVKLAAADVDNDGLKELIVAEGWQFLWAYDVDRQLPKWSISTSQDIGAILVSDVDGDGAVDLLVGQGQWGDIMVFDPVTQQLKGSIHNPEHGVTNIAVGDTDGDGFKDLLWGAGASSSGQDHLYVASWQTRLIKWQNVHLDGPFVGPEIGDLDGDGRNEIVVMSLTSNAGYDGGRILVFDAITRKLRAISDPIAGSFVGARDIRLRDTDRDGQLDILIASGYDGVIRIYGFDTLNTFTLKWTNNTSQAPAAFFSVDAADIDGDGEMEIVAGSSQGSQGICIYVYNYNTRNEEWHSLHMPGGAITALGLADVNRDGSLEIIGMGNESNVYIFDGPTKLLESILFGPFSAMRVQNVAGSASIALGNDSGDLIMYRYVSNSYTEVYRQRLINTPVSGFTIDHQDNVWISSSTQFGSNATLTKLSLAGATLASYTGYGPTFGLRVGFVAGTSLFFTTSTFSVLGFPGGIPLPGTIGVYLPANQTFYLRNSNTIGFADYTVRYGPPGAIPIVGDWDGNGTVTIGVFDPGDQSFYLRNSNTIGLANIAFRYGPPGAIPLAGDWNGDGVTTIGVYDPPSQTFYLRNTNSAGFADLTIRYGPPGAVPIVGDWDGDGTVTIGVYDPGSQTFYLRNSNTQGFADVTVGYGPSGAIPVVGDWDGNGTVTIGVYDPATQTFYLRNSNSIGFADLTIRYGPSGVNPLAGNWDGL